MGVERTSAFRALHIVRRVHLVIAAKKSPPTRIVFIIQGNPLCSSIMKSSGGCALFDP